MSTQKTCENCAHSFIMRAPDPKVSGGAIVCRRFPPQVCMVPVPGATLATQGNPQGIAMIPQAFPPPVAVDWSCSEFAEGAARVVMQ